MPRRCGDWPKSSSTDGLDPRQGRALNAKLPLTHLLLLLVICAAWGGNFLFSALALRELPALLFTALRLALVALLLLPWLRWPRRGQV